MSYQVDSYGNTYFPAGVSIASIPATTGTQAKVLVPGVNGRISSATISQLIAQSGGNLVSSVFGRTGAVTAAIGDYNTDQVTEGQSLYFSTSRARKCIYLTTFNTSGPATYDSSTGIINVPQYGSASNGNFVPLTRKISINGQTADLSVDRAFSVDTIPYPSLGIALSNGTSWGASITNNSANWNTAFSWGNHAGLYSLLNHIHIIANVTGLQTALDGKEPTITAGTTLQYWRGDKTWQTLPVYTLSGLGGEPTIAAGTTLQYWRGDKTWQTLPIYVLPIATASVLGGIKVGTNLSINATTGVLDATFTYTLPTASTTVLGGIKVGTNLSIDANGVLSSTDTNTTYANFTRTVSGLVPNPGGSTTTRYLREDGTWVVPPDTDTDTVYVHPTTAGNKHIPAGGAAGQILRWSADGAAAWGADVDTDTNTWNANTKDVAGYVAAPGAVANKVWKTDALGNPAWRDDADTDTNTTYSAFTGATASANGTAGLVIAPLVANRAQYLKGDGTWGTPPDTIVTSLAWTSITGRPTALSQFTNDLGNYGSFLTAESDTLATVTARGSSTAQNITFSNGRKGLVGVYDAAQTQAIFAMGAAYILTDGGASSNIGNLYGLAWSYNPNYAGAGNNPQSIAGLNHQLLLMQNGITTAAMGSGIWTSGNVTATTFIGSIAWTSVTSRPTALTQFTNDLGNYGGFVVRTGDTMTNRLTIDSRTINNNLPLHILAVEPYMQIEATGASNSTAIKMYSTGGYNALVGNYATGELVLVAAGTEVAYLNSNSIRVAKYRFNGNSTLSGSGTPEIVDIANVGMAMQSLNYKWYNNSANVLYMTLDYNGNLTANAFFESSDIRYKDVIETNPNLTLEGLDVIKFTRKGNSIIRYGYSAQQVKSLSEDLIGGTNDDMTVNYSDVHTLKIAALEKRIAELEAKLK